MRSFIITIACLLSLNGLGQSNQEEEFICGTIESASERSVRMFNNSTNGLYFTPKGDLRVLVIYIDFVNTTEQSHPLGIWPKDGPMDMFPQNHVDLTTGEITWGHDEFSDFSPLGNPLPDDNQNISEYYYQMSQGALRMYFETVKTPSGSPTNVVVDPRDPDNPGSYLSRSEIDALVFEKIRNDYPMDWSRFDIRPDIPEGNYDASEVETCLLSDTCNSNNVLDYIIMVYRNKKDWNDPIITSAGNGSSGTIIGTLNDGYTTRPRATYHSLHDQTFRTKFTEVIIHEIGHGYFLAPHYGMANDTHNQYLYSNFMWNMMKGHGQVNTLSNSFENWFSGWNEITYDIDESTSTSSPFTLDDFLQTGESMRIKLPHTQDQFIWLENHGDSNPFYGRRTYKFDANGNPIPLQQAGMYGYIEKVRPTRDSGWPISVGRNGLKIINGSGHYDYENTGYQQLDYYWDNFGLTVNQLEENPYGGHHSAVKFRFDENNNGTIFHTLNSGNEGDFIMEISGQPAWGFLANDVVLTQNKLSAFTNPALTNFQEINKNVTVNAMSPVVLHSLSISSNANLDGTYNVTVNYNDGLIENDFRMTGNIYLPANEIITLDKSRNLLLNRTQSPNVTLELPDGSFYDYTVFIAAEDGTLILDDDSDTILDEGTTMIFEGGSSLELKDETAFYIRGGSLLCIKEGANVTLDSSSRIYVEDGFLEVHPSIDISANVIYTDDYIGSVQVSTDLDYCFVNSPEHLHSILGTDVSGPNCETGLVVIDVDDQVRLTSESYVEIFDEFEAVPGSYFEAYISSAANDCDKEFWFGSGGVPGLTSGGDDKERTQREISEDEAPFKVYVSPNPSNGTFSVRLNEPLESFTYEVYGFMGGAIAQGEHQSVDHFDINILGANPGIYFLRIQSNTGTVTTKIVIQ